MLIKKVAESISKIEGKTEYFFSHILVPLWILTFYFLSFSKLLPEGINRVFVTKSGKYTFLLVSALSLVFILILIFQKKRVSFLRKSEEKFSTANFILLLLPLTPVAQYILNNLEILSLLEAIYIFFIFVIFVAFFVLFILLFFIFYFF